MKINKEIRIAICQLMVTSDKFINIEKAEKALHKASLQGCDIAVLPEMFSCPYENDFFYEFAEDMLANTAKREGIYIIGGSLPEKNNEKYYNVCFSFNREGALLGVHRKIHLFDINIRGKIKFTESLIFSPSVMICASPN